MDYWRRDDYKDKVPFEKRREETMRIMGKYPGRLPVLVQRHRLSKTAPEMKNKKFLVPKDLNVGHLCYIIRRRMKLNSSEALFLSINGKFPVVSKVISELYEEEKEKDLFLYVYYQTENTFGY